MGQQPKKNEQGGQRDREGQQAPGRGDVERDQDPRNPQRQNPNDQRSGKPGEERPQHGREQDGQRRDQGTR